jgi:hypothetical protein
MHTYVRHFIALLYSLSRFARNRTGEPDYICSNNLMLRSIPNSFGVCWAVCSMNLAEYICQFCTFWFGCFFFESYSILNLDYTEATVTFLLVTKMYNNIHFVYKSYLKMPFWEKNEYTKTMVQNFRSFPNQNKSHLRFRYFKPADADLYRNILANCIFDTVDCVTISGWCRGSRQNYYD